PTEGVRALEARTQAHGSGWAGTGLMNLDPERWVRVEAINEGLELVAGARISAHRPGANRGWVGGEERIVALEDGHRSIPAGHHLLVGPAGGRDSEVVVCSSGRARRGHASNDHARTSRDASYRGWSTRPADEGDEQ